MLYSGCRTPTGSSMPPRLPPGAPPSRIAPGGRCCRRAPLPHEGPAMPPPPYLEAAVVGLLQGVSEMFPVSSLGHSVLIPAIAGGAWARDLNVAAPESPYLAFIVGLHVATAIALLIYFWRDWVRIIGGFFSSIRDRRVHTNDQKLAWMIILAPTPVGIAGLAFEHAFRVIFGKPILAGIFLAVNGVILLAGERYRSRASLAADATIAAERNAGFTTPARQPRFTAPAREPELAGPAREP